MTTVEPTGAGLASVLAARATEHPDEPALVTPGRPALTAAALAHHLIHVGRHLRALDVRRGDAVIVALPHGADGTAAVVAVAASTACAPVDPDTPEPLLGRLLDAIQPHAAVIWPGAPEALRSAIEARHLVTIELSLSADADADVPAGRFAIPGPPPPAQTLDVGGPGSVALVLPCDAAADPVRVVALTHYNLLAAAQATADALMLTPADRALALAPPWTVDGFVAGTLAPLVSRGSVLPAGTVDADVTWVAAGPNEVAAFAAAPPAPEAAAGLRFVRAAGAPLLPVLRSQLTATGVHVVEAYGWPETAGLGASTPPVPGRAPAGTIGTAEGIEVAIVAADGTRVEPGEPGLVLLRGPSVAEGYVGDVEATTERFAAGWFHTGDRGVLDADGHLAVERTRLPLPEPHVAAPRDAPRARILPATPAQRDAWRRRDLRAERDPQTVVVPIGIEGPLDADALGLALARVVDRHAALRTTLREGPGGLDQVVAPPGTVAIGVTVDDVRRRPAEERPGHLQRAIRHEVRRPFDLTTGPVLRARLLRFAAEDHVLVLTTHRAAADRRSEAVLAGDLAATYAGVLEAAGGTGPVDQAATTAADELRRPDRTAALAWWVAHLAGARPHVALPFDRPRPDHPSGVGATVTVAVPDRVIGALTDLAKQGDVGPSVALLAGFAALLQRYAGADDVLVGTPVAGAAGAAVDSVGPFAHDLPLRLAVGTAGSYRAVLQRIVDELRSVEAHADVPPDELASEIGTSPCNVAFSAAPPPPVVTAGGARFRLLRTDQATVPVDLWLDVDDAGTAVEARFTFAAERFDRTSIERLAAQYLRLLDAVADDPDAALFDLEVDDDQAPEPPATWAGRSLYVALDRAVPELVAAHAHRHGELVAVVDGEVALTYTELAARAVDLGHHLRDAGVTPGTTVEIDVPPSAAHLVAVVGALAAGATVCATGHAGVLVDREFVDAVAPSGAGTVPLVPPPDVDADALILAAGDGGAGTVAFTHRALLSLRAALDRAVYRGRHGRRLRVATVAAPATVGWVPALVALTEGHEVHIAHDGDVDALLGAGGAEVLFVPAEAAESVAASVPDGCPGLLVVTGGPVSPDAWRALAASPAEVLQLSGPPEAFGAALSCAVADHDAPVLGRPVANTVAWVLDHRLRPASTAVPGDLYVGGPLLARGYAGDDAAAMDDDRFVDDPWHAGRRLVATGGRARWRDDGWLEPAAPLPRVDVAPVVDRVATAPIPEPEPDVQGLDTDTVLIEAVEPPPVLPQPDLTVAEPEADVAQPEAPEPAAVAFVDAVPAATAEPEPEPAVAARPPAPPPPPREQNAIPTTVLVTSEERDLTVLTPLSERLGGETHVVGLAAPDLAAVGLPAAAGAVVRALDGEGERGPWRLLGHGTGASIVVELAGLLTDRGDGVELVTIVDTPSPTLRRRRLRRAGPAPVPREWAGALVVLATSRTLDQADDDALGWDAVSSGPLIAYELTVPPAEVFGPVGVDMLGAVIDAAARRLAEDLDDDPDEAGDHDRA